MANLAHYDPDLISRNLKGMSNGSKLDKIIFEEFYQNLEELSCQAEEILKKLKGKEYSLIRPDIDLINIPEGESRETTTKARIEQYFFRKTVLASYSGRCCVTGINNQQLLVASHIKPWAESDIKTERTNPCNGLCLNALHDKAFDRGLMTIDREYKIVLSTKLHQMKMDEATKMWFESYDEKEIVLPDRFLPSKEFIEYHNDVIFQR